MNIRERKKRRTVKILQSRPITKLDKKNTNINKKMYLFSIMKLIVFLKVFYYKLQ